jgi:hypothetical protein
MEIINHMTLKAKVSKRTTLGCVNTCAPNVHPYFLDNHSLINACQLLADFLQET